MSSILETKKVTKKRPKSPDTEEEEEEETPKKKKPKKKSSTKGNIGTKKGRKANRSLDVSEPTAEDFEIFAKTRKRKPVKDASDVTPSVEDLNVLRALDRLKNARAKVFNVDPRHCGAPPSIITSRGFHVSHTLKIKHHLLKLGDHCNQKPFIIAIGNVSSLLCMSLLRSSSSFFLCCSVCACVCYHVSFCVCLVPSQSG